MKVEVNIGDRYGRCLILEEISPEIKIDKKRNRKFRMVKYLCECGAVGKTRLQSLRNGLTKSCGCYGKEKSSQICTERNSKHGLRYHRLYKTWRGMIDRCENKRSVSYKNYGGRGIRVCDEWHNIQIFIEDMSHSYKEGLTIDRIDNDGNYCKENCRWATRKQQQANKRKTLHKMEQGTNTNL